MLSLLIVHIGRVVQTDSFIDELWGDKPPPTARTTLHTYVYQLRRAIPDDPDVEPASAERSRQRTSAKAAGKPWLRTTSTGYIADIPPDNIDLCQFQSLARAGQQALKRGAIAEASTLLRDALALWRGPFTADVRHGRILDAHATKLEEERLQVVEQSIDAEMRFGLHRELVGELRKLVIEHPFTEGLRQWLMLALYRSDRRFEAIREYQRLRRMLVDELGLEPSRSLQKLHEAMLNSDPALDLQPTACCPPQSGPQAALPASTDHFPC